MLFFIIFFQKVESNRLKKSRLTKIFVILFLLLDKIGLVGPVDQQINLVLPCKTFNLIWLALQYFYKTR